MHDSTMHVTPVDIDSRETIGKICHACIDSFDGGHTIDNPASRQGLCIAYGSILDAIISPPDRE